MPERLLRAVVVDDEQLAREELCYVLDEVGGVEVVAEAGNGLEALDAIGRLEPDLVFLDVQMPGLTGFEVARKLADREPPVTVIFVTAYRPARDRGVRGQCGRLPAEAHRQPAGSKRPSSGPGGAWARGPTERPPRTHRPTGGGAQDAPEQVAVKVGDRLLLVQAEDIIFASMADDSITIVAGHVSGTCNFRTLDELQARLDPAVFWRVHRSHLVNINKIKEIVPWFSRNYILRMKDAKATEIPVSRSQTRRLREYLRL